MSGYPVGTILMELQELIKKSTCIRTLSVPASEWSEYLGSGDMMIEDDEGCMWELRVRRIPFVPREPTKEE